MCGPSDLTFDVGPRILSTVILQYITSDHGPVHGVADMIDTIAVIRCDDHLLGATDGNGQLREEGSGKNSGQIESHERIIEMENFVVQSRSGNREAACDRAVSLLRSGRMEDRSTYKEDLAYIHHVGFGDFSRAAASGLLRILHQAGIRHGTLVDLACGSGRWARAAGDAGFSVIGVDRSPAMIRLARRVAPAARLRCASLHVVDLPPCEAVTAIGEGLTYLSPTDRRPPRLQRLFERVAMALRPGGLFIFDATLPGGKPMSGRNWRAGRDWAVLTEVKELSAASKLLTRRIVSFRKIHAQWRRSEEVHRVQLCDRAKTVRALVRAGFSVQTRRHYGAMSLLPRRLAFIARKAG